jgi:outer membrane murein-binding lipoprotein Lpp
MKNKILISTSLLATLLFTGCGIRTNEYNVSADNVQTLRNYENLKMDVSTFTATNKDESSVMCRLAETVSTPKGEPFSEYIKDAFVSELKMAEVYDKNSDLKISGNLNKIYGSSMFGNAYWEMDVTVTSSNGNSITVNTKRDYPSSYLASSACNNMGTSFAPSIKQLIGDILEHKDFPKLVKK